MSDRPLKRSGGRPIGRSGIEVGPLCLGANVFGWTIDEPTSFRILDAAVDAGVDFIDTADVYSRWKPGNEGGESETIIGRWLARSGKRDRIVLATKCGMEMGEGEVGLSKAYIRRAVERSLRRLQTDRIDLYQAHKDDPATPVEETLEAFGDLIREGKVRAAGASNFSAERLGLALELAGPGPAAAGPGGGRARYECLQPHYNLCERKDFEDTLGPLCRSAGVGVIPYFALARGFLSGKYRSEADLGKSAARASGVKPYLNERGFRILAALDEVAARLGSRPASIALAWLMARPGITAPIASATSLEQLDDLVAATRLTLDAAATELLDRASAPA